ncbi:nicotinamide mononucleotide adenylyltransferase [Paenibacillus alvei]|nr:nicotinamide mononucleotide adenylyltransferase [Paenibacillus alvei DSM 29]MCY9544706.1 nicotinamide mononucleotide adenylyltransferase [Paenibacillus alvei]MCY9707722.1 nicotinamide mononucleotide adenylyltransferase [Paenibacillus alvei]MCY9757703.1 nicotinamide mononucleotide adenylyltransferase [Paenibacillus alvei]
MLHAGHEHLINSAKEKCENLLVLVGSAQESGTTRNPFDIKKRVDMMDKLFGDKPNIHIGFVADYTNENDHSHEWGRYLLRQVDGWRKFHGIDAKVDCMIYGNDEERNGWFDPKDIEGITQIQLDRAYIPISATQMRGYMAWNQKGLWMQYANPKLHVFYEELRQKLFEVKP